VRQQGAWRLQVQHALAVRFCDAAEPHLKQTLADWAAAAGEGSLEARSGALLTAWGATRAFEKRLMATVEGIHSAAAPDDSEYAAVKARAAGHVAGGAAGTPRASAFDRRLRGVFDEHLGVTIDWHTAVLDRAMQLLVEQDAANGWAAAGGKPGRLDSARGLMLECRKQADNALTVLAQSGPCVRSFMEGMASVLQARPAGRVLALCLDCLIGCEDKAANARCYVHAWSVFFVTVQAHMPRPDHQVSLCGCRRTRSSLTRGCRLSAATRAPTRRPPTSTRPPPRASARSSPPPRSCSRTSRTCTTSSRRAAPPTSTPTSTPAAGPSRRSFPRSRR
jgi:hypothetical protein